MEHVSSFKPLDIEKTTSNLICKLVDLGEWKQALEELRKLRQRLANLANIQLGSEITTHLVSGNVIVPASNVIDYQHTSIANNNHDSKTFNNLHSPSAVCINSNENILMEPPNQLHYARHILSLSPESPPDGNHAPNISPCELDMIQQYGDLFALPLDITINDRSLILLVLAYQMNVIRSWCDINSGVLVKYIAILLDQPGNFIDWCKHMMSYDDVTAKKQLDLLERHLTFTVSKVSTFDNPQHVMAIQILALKASAHTGKLSLQLLCDRFMRLVITYEKNAYEVKYDDLQKHCGDLLRILQQTFPESTNDEAYFAFCEYYIYVSHKANINSGMIHSLTAMHQLLSSPRKTSSIVDYYHVTYSIHVKLSLCTAQMDQMTRSNSYIDIVALFTDANSSIQSLIKIIENNEIESNRHTKEVTMKFYSIMNVFLHSATQVWEMIQQCHSNCPTVSQSPDLLSPQIPSVWKSYTEVLSDTLQQCSVLLPIALILVEKMGWAKCEPASSLSPSAMAITNVDTMILLAKLHFDARNDTTYHQAYDCLATAEQICSDHMVSSGYRWISATYYTLGAGMITIHSLSNAVYPLRKSCMLLEKDSERMNLKAGKIQLVKRYEVLGTCCQKIGDLEGAIKAYRLALNHLPTTTIDLFTTGSDQMTISKMIQQQPLVPKLIDRFLRSSFSNNEQSVFSTELMDLSTLTPIQKCVLHECELKVLFGLSPRLDLTKSQSWLIGSLLHHYTPDRYPIRRGRTLLSLVRIIHANGLADEQSMHTAIKHAEEAHEILTKKDYGFDSNLLAYRRHYLALTFSWLGILRREVNDTSPDTFVSALQHWGRLFKEIDPLPSTRSTLKERMEIISQQVDDIDSLYDHLRLLADLFGLIGHFTLQINTLRMLLKLNHGLRQSSVDHISDSIITITDIGRLYMDIGYSGKANLEFEKVKIIMAKHPCSLQAELHYLMQYSQYFSTIGAYDESLATFNAARTLWEAENTPADCKKFLWPLKLQAVNYVLLSDCYLSRSAISLHKESMNSAITDATSSYQTLCNFVRSIKQKTESNPTENNAFGAKVDNNNSEQTEDLDQSPATTSDLLFKEYQWTIAKKMSHALQRLALLHMVQGTWRDAQYYLLQGQQLGERIKSNTMVYQFLLLLHDSYLCTGQIDKSRSGLKAANAIRLKATLYLQDEARMNIAIGHSHAKENMLDKALQSYNMADLLYRKMMDPACIVTFGRLSKSDEELERHISSSSDTQQMEGAAEYECKPLQEKLGEIAVYKALVMSRKGLVSTALKVLEEFEEPRAISTKNVILAVIGARIRLMLAKDEFKNHANLIFLDSNVFTLPPLCLSSQLNCQNQERSKAAQNLRLVWNDVSSVLECLTATHKRSARIEKVDLVENLCRDAGFALFLKYQTMMVGGTPRGNSSALTGYYLDMAKSIGLRREMQIYLNQKLTVRQSRVVDDLVWPRCIGDAAPKKSPSLLAGQTVEYFVKLRDIYQQEHNLNDTEFQTQFIDILPPHWTVCSLSLDPIPQELYVARYCSGKLPHVVKLPLGRADERRRRLNPGHTGHANVGVTYEQAIVELEYIIQRSDETIHFNKETLLVEDVENWWMIRSKLDTRMKKLLEQIERSWIGGFKGLFCGRHQVYEEAFVSFQQSIYRILLENIYGPATSSNKCVLEIDEQTLHMILRLGTSPIHHDLEDIVYFLLSCYECHDICIDYSDTIIIRMTQQIRHAIQSYHDQAALAGINTLERLPNEHIILIPDKLTQQFPWESIPTLRTQPVSRLPCISFLRDRILQWQLQQLGQSYYPGKYGLDADVVVNENQLNEGDAWKEITVDSSLSYYLLNPSGDLKYTQANFESIFSRMDSWEGHVQKKPTETECRSMLIQKDLYMYFGHGAGQSIIRGQIIRQLPRCPVALLMGCSSGRLQSNGEYDTDGYVMNYLLAGSPAVVVNLWDVTDKSIDQVGKGMMDRWGLFNGTTNQHEEIRKNKPSVNMSLVEALCLSRDDCPLPYLTGAATVVYGVPVYVL
ncbi:unnamed protein product [Absidia cylindrospora]